MKARTRRVKYPGDFREVLFTATGRDTPLGKLTTIDVFDNLIVEADRLRTLVDLLGASNEALEVGSLGGLSLLLGDIQRRLRLILEAAVEGEGGAGGRERLAKT